MMKQKEKFYESHDIPSSLTNPHSQSTLYSQICYSFWAILGPEIINYLLPFINFVYRYEKPIYYAIYFDNILIE